MLILKGVSEKGYQASKPCRVHGKVFILPKTTRLAWFLQQLGEPCEGLWASTSSGSHSGGGTQLQVPNNPKLGLQWRFELCTSTTPKPLMHQGPVQKLHFNCQQAARVTHELSAGPPVAAGNEKELCFPLLESCPPLQMLCRQLCCACLPLRTSKQVEVRPRRVTGQLLELGSIQKDWKLPDVRQRFAPLLHRALYFPCTVLWKL